MSPVESKAAKAIEQRMEDVEPGTPRFELLEKARKFKTSWVELGHGLVEVQRKKLFTAWGFPSFEAYCQDEIRIKPRTAAKLTASYSFLRDEEPAVLKRDGLQRPIPDPDVIDILRRARKETGEEEYRRIKELALDEAPMTALRKELRQHLPPAAEKPKPANTLLKRVVDQAERLADNLAGLPGIPRVIVERALALVDDLRALVEN